VVKFFVIVAVMAMLQGCATAANEFAVGICQQSRNCTVTDTTPPRGPQQQRVIEPTPAPRPK
jgi:hypothetical protein